MTSAAFVNRSNLSLFVGALSFLVMYMMGFYQTVMPAAAWQVTSVAVLMAIWWATEALPVAVTALLPVIVLPLLGFSDVRTLGSSYAHPLIFLFLGAFILALGLERWNLHRRLALNILLRTGTEGSRLIAGFMLIAALLSMGMTNTSTTMMLLPIALSVSAIISEREDVSEQHKQAFTVALLLGVAFGATIGGMATLIGTPPNALLAAFVSEQYGIDIGFSDWLVIGLPVTIFMLPLTWWVLTRLVFKFEVPASEAVNQHVKQMTLELGAMTQSEKRVGMVFLLVVLAWAFRKPIVAATGMSSLSDAGIALIGALLLFIIPARSQASDKLMTWDVAKTLPWAVLLLFGGGLSLAAAVSQSGLAVWLGEMLSPVSVLGLFALMLAISFTVVYLTELTSNLATTATFLPIVAAVAVQLDLNPLLLCVPVALAASCAFMLPVATAPNAIVYSSGRFQVADMARAGMRLNIVAGLFITAFCYVALNRG